MLKKLHLESEVLRYLNFVNCWHLVSVMPSDLLFRAQHLEELQLEGLKELQGVFRFMSRNQIPLLPKVKTVELRNMPGMTSIWEGDIPDGSLQSVRNLCIERCCHLKHVLSPAMVHSQAFKELQELKITFCEQLEQIISSEKSGSDQVPAIEVCAIFSCLRTLVVRGCDQLTSLFSWRQLQGLHQLRILHIIGCGEMNVLVATSEPEEDEAMVDKKSVLPLLTEIYVSKLPMFRKYHIGSSPSSISLPSLKRISVDSSQQLKQLPLGYKSSPKLENIFGSEGWFRNLEWGDKRNKLRFQALFCVVTNILGEFKKKFD